MFDFARPATDMLSLEVVCLIALCYSDRQQLCWLTDEWLSAGNAGRQYGLLGFFIMSKHQVVPVTGTASVVFLSHANWVIPEAPGT